MSNELHRPGQLRKAPVFDVVGRRCACHNALRTFGDPDHT